MAIGKSLFKEFNTFEEGIVELTQLIPDIAVYVGDNINIKDVTNSLIDIIKEDIPTVDSEAYPNTLSISISAREVGFKTDENLAFGWRVWIDKNKNTPIGYQFRITFITIPRSKKYYVDTLLKNKWKEKTDGIQSKFWDEIATPERKLNETQIIQETEETDNDEIDDVQDEPVENNIPKYQFNAPLPTFYQEEDNEVSNEPDMDNNSISEDSEEEQVQVEPEPIRELIKPAKSFLSKGLMSKHKFPIREEEEEPEQEEESEPEPAREPIKPAKSFLSKGLMPKHKFPIREEEEEPEQEPIEPEVVDDNESIIQESHSPIRPRPMRSLRRIGEEEPETIEEKEEARRLLSVPKKMLLANTGRVTQSTQNIEEEENVFGEELDPRMYNIKPTEKQYEVLITYEGQTFPFNVNSSMQGVIKYTAEKKLVIENTFLYDYANWTVTMLPEDYAPDQAQFVSSDQEEVVRTGRLPDQVFVPRETIMRNSTFNVDQVRDEAIKNAEFKARMQGVAPNIPWKKATTPTPNNNERQPFILRPKTNNGVLRRGRAFVVNNGDQE